MLRQAESLQRQRLSAIMTPAAPACCAFLAFWTKEQAPRSTIRIKGDGQIAGLLVSVSVGREG